MNKVFLVGRLANDVEKFESANRNVVVRMTIAVSDSWNRNEAFFFPCVCFNNNASFANTYLKKGDLISIDGRLTRKSFVNKEGKTSYVTEIIVDNINRILSKQTNLQNSNERSNETKTASIDEAFPENIPINNHTDSTEKPIQFQTKDHQEIEWPDDEDEE